MADNKTPAEAALAIVSAIARKIEAFEQQLEVLDKAEKAQKSVHGLTATPSFKASQDGRTVPHVSRDVFKQLAKIKKAEAFIDTGNAGDPKKRIKMVGKANDVVAGKDLPIEQSQKSAADLTKVMGMGSAPAAPAPAKKPLGIPSNPGNPQAKMNMGNAFNSLNTPGVQKGTPDLSKPPQPANNPAPSPKGAVASPTPKAPKAPAPGVQKSAVGVFGKIKKCGEVTMPAPQAKGVK